MRPDEINRTERELEVDFRLTENDDNCRAEKLNLQ